MKKSFSGILIDSTITIKILNKKINIFIVIIYEIIIYIYMLSLCRQVLLEKLRNSL